MLGKKGIGVVGVKILLAQGRRLDVMQGDLQLRRRGNQNIEKTTFVVVVAITVVVVKGKITKEKKPQNPLLNYSF